MKLLTVVGARPQFVKAAAVSRVLRKEHREILVHTGQHYDRNMSQIFFDELHIPTPDYNLGVGSGSHAKQTASMLVGVEDILLMEKPDAVLVYGDTNSTLAAALAASKILIPVVHVEAGLRSYNFAMPEEQNRVLTDHISRVLFAPTQTAVDNLAKEGIAKGVYNVGDVMADAVFYYTKETAEQDPQELFADIEALYGSLKGVDDYYLATIHRAENTDVEEKLWEVLDAFEALDHPVIFPIHPRTRRAALARLEEKKLTNTILVAPVGYKEMLTLTQHAVKVVTDSGGLQKEAYLLETPCVTVRPQTEWVETLNGGHNVLVAPERDAIVEAVLHQEVDGTNHPDYYGKGDAGQKITDILAQEGVLS
ncbi:MAG: UDP-N-acetylglucosamine 2-epimerase (non-hydrolyzing) [Peptoniphilaceae bacterium]|nr:UDP-N-acetylglucosamine 2-epimerase (non-hydrolyzing) [Peptoniphilaceae bacterium]MDY6086353.1 UDP-N-acetylglucosamine 2-epimerase (non-hydrolyzing) [Peptoniphilaceae bacterium]